MFQMKLPAEMKDGTKTAVFFPPLVLVLFRTLLKERLDASLTVALCDWGRKK